MKQHTYNYIIGVGRVFWVTGCSKASGLSLKLCRIMQQTCNLVEKQQFKSLKEE